VNEEVGFLLHIMGDLGDLLRVRLKKKKKLKLKVRNDIGKAYTAEEKERMLAEAANARSPTFIWHSRWRSMRVCEMRNFVGSLGNRSSSRRVI
jgi:hypothetical protein